MVAVVDGQHDVRHGREVDAPPPSSRAFWSTVSGRYPASNKRRRPSTSTRAANPHSPTPRSRAWSRERDVEGLDLTSRGGRLATSDPGSDQQCRQRGSDARCDHDGLPLGRTSLIWTQTHPSRGSTRPAAPRKRRAFCSARRNVADSPLVSSITIPDGHRVRDRLGELVERQTSARPAAAGRRGTPARDTERRVIQPPADRS